MAREPGAPDGRVRLRLAVTTRRFHARELEPAEAAQRWLTAVFRPALDRIRESVSPGRDFVQAYCDLLEHKWLLSERARHDVGLDAAMGAYLAEGAPAPELPAREPPEMTALETAQALSDVLAALDSDTPGDSDPHRS